MSEADVRDVAINIFAGLALIVIGAMAQQLANRWRFRFQRRMWRPFGGKYELGICLTTRAGPLPRSTRRVSLSEARAVASIVPVISRLGLSYRLFDPSATDADTLGKMNLLVLGSPFANNISQEIVEFLDPVITVTVNEDPRILTIADENYSPAYSDNGKRVVRDHAVILKAPNPYDADRSRWIILVMGCHGFGTEGAVQFLTQPRLINKVLAKAGDNAFVCVVDIRVVGRVYDSEIVDVRLLATPN